MGMDNDILKNLSEHAESGEGFDLASLKLDAIVAEPDFDRGRSVGDIGAASVSESSPSSASEEKTAGAAAPAAPVSASPAALQPAASVQPNLTHQTEFVAPLNSPRARLIKLAIYATIILFVVSFVGYKVYHRYKVTQKHDWPMADYDFDYSYLENLGALPMQGNPNAYVTLSVWCDFQCPYCPKIGDEVDDILRKYDGDLRVVWVNFPLYFHFSAFPAAYLAIAAYSQGKYWEMKDELYAHQKEFTTPGYFMEAAKRVGLDMDDLDNVLSNPDLIDEVADAIATGEALGIGGTPAMMVNKYALPPKNKKVMEDIIGFEIERAKAIAKSTGYTGEDLFRELLDTAPENVEVGNRTYFFGEFWENHKKTIERRNKELEKMMRK